MSFKPSKPKGISLYSAFVSGGAGGALAPPEFGSSLNLFQPEGADYAHHITGSTPGFGNLTTAHLTTALLYKIEEAFKGSKLNIFVNSYIKFRKPISHQISSNTDNPLVILA